MPDLDLPVEADENSIAEIMYTTYCEAVGGKAFNGYPLPPWAVFVVDPTKQKQVKAWRAVGRVALHLVRDDPDYRD